MLYSVKHTTTYLYHETVPLCHNLAVLAPRDTASQTCRSFQLDISPVAEIIEEYQDFFGNKVFYFVVEQEHEKLSVITTSIIERRSSGLEQQAVSLQSWESVKDMLRSSTGDFIREKQYAIPADMTVPSAAIKQYASPSFTPRRPLFEAVSDLMRRIYTDFTYTSGFTTVSTPLSVVMKERKGVCQDFAHLGIACLQSMGLAAKYISGYLETIPPPGKEKLAGADASHAWFSVYIPEMGWVDFDPTNNKIPDEQYIVIGWGRNYFDIVPLRGVIMSSDQHQLFVSVDVKRITT
ncbi:transglutaminase family protein [Pseudoflavitalea sp. X16]|uniref:transglutaminase family protein n=1 Tax=Paraflavitalea devenefica TaxID=2716334 RepID=UPI00141F8C1E|nr:transglutaminase family protein [Paraflavitalea devenefica]NII29535.1 transglutaminase family protein [Paraflavitalea devenefica]